MAEVLVREPVDLLSSKESAEALAAVLRLGGIVYIPADGLADSYAPLDYCSALEKAMPGVRVTYYTRGALSGPASMLGHERLRFEVPHAS